MQMDESLLFGSLLLEAVNVHMHRVIDEQVCI